MLTDSYGNVIRVGTHVRVIVGVWSYRQLWLADRFALYVNALITKVKS